MEEGNLVGGVRVAGKSGAVVDCVRYGGSRRFDGNGRFDGSGRCNGSGRFDGNERLDGSESWCEVVGVSA